MEKNKKLEILEALENRGYEQLDEIEPASEDCGHLLNNLAQLNYMVRDIKGEWLQTAPVNPEEPPQMPNTPEPASEAVAPEVIGSDEQSVKQPTMTLEEVRAKLIDYARAGVDLAAVMQQLGCSKLSEVPADKYALLLESAERAAEEAA